MASNKSLKRQKQQHKLNSLPKILGIGLLITLLSGQLLFDIRMAGRQDDNSLTVAASILAGIENSNKPAVIEPVSKKTYLPDANLVLPAVAKLGDVRYSYTPDFDTSDAFMQVTLDTVQSKAVSKMFAGTYATPEARNDYEAMFLRIATAQSCARGLNIQFGTKEGYGTPVITKQLADGRPMSVYQEKPGCPYNLQPLLDALKQAESY